MGKYTLLHVMVILAVPFASLGWSVGVTDPSFAKTSDTILYVKAETSGDCSSWVQACDLQTALGTATKGDEIWVQAGIHKPTANPSQLTVSFQLKSGVAIFGGFAGGETARGQRDWASRITVLSGDLGGDDETDNYGVINDTENIVGINSLIVVNGSEVNASAVLDGFTITAGNAIYYGGGMSNWYGGSPTLENLIFSGNKAGEVGGGMFNYINSNPTLINVTFSGNSAVGNGGGMVNHESSPSLTNVTFSGNSAGNAAGMVNSSNSNPILTDVTFSKNRASNKAGGMENDENSSPVLSNVTFSDNSARYGGGMYNYQSNPSLTEVTFSGNSAGHVGGGMENEGSSPILINVTFVNNRAVHEGGGMFNGNGSNPSLTNVTFSNNSVTGDATGGGIINYSSNPIMTNVTFYGNSTRSSGGGIANSASYPKLTNVIVWGNKPAENQIYNVNSSPVITYSDIQGGYAGIGNISADPQLDLLSDNGGSTLTHALQVGSPVIDAGNPEFCPKTDQRGMPRPIDGNGDSKASCDMGSFEYQTPTPITEETPMEDLDLARIEITNKTDGTVSIILLGGRSSYTLNVGAGMRKNFTLEKGAYSRTTHACGYSDVGTVEITRQLRLVFTPCWGLSPNMGEPSMEKIHLPDMPYRKNWYHK